MVIYNVAVANKKLEEIIDTRLEHFILSVIELEKFRPGEHITFKKRFGYIFRAKFKVQKFSNKQKQLIEECLAKHTKENYEYLIFHSEYKDKQGFRISYTYDNNKRYKAWWKCTLVGLINSHANILQYPYMYHSHIERENVYCISQLCFTRPLRIYFLSTFYQPAYQKEEKQKRKIGVENRGEKGKLGNKREENLET